MLHKKLPERKWNAKGLSWENYFQSKIRYLYEAHPSDSVGRDPSANAKVWSIQPGMVWRSYASLLWKRHCHKFRQYIFMISMHQSSLSCSALLCCRILDGSGRLIHLGIEKGSRKILDYGTKNINNFGTAQRKPPPVLFPSAFYSFISERTKC